MTAINEFNKGNIDKIMDECREALEPVAEKYGLVLQRKSWTFRPDNSPVPFRLLVPERAEDGSAISTRETEFRKYAHRFGLKPDDFGKTFKTFNGVYRICGIKPKGRKYTVLGESIVNGGVYKFPHAPVIASLSSDR